MSDKQDDLAIRELTKTVLAMEKRIISLEKLVLDQNVLLKKILSDQESAGVVNLHENDTEEGRSTSAPVVKRPMRDAKLRATCALAANARNKTKVARARNVSPALSLVSAGARVPESNASSSRSAPPTPTTQVSSLQQPAIISQNIPIAARPAVNHTQQDGMDINNTTDWTEVTHRRSRRPPSNVTRGTAVPGSAACVITAADRKSYLHLYFVKTGTTAEQVLIHLRTICPNDNCSAEVLKSRGDYASFKLTVPTKNLDEYLKPDCWPQDVHIKPWRSGFRNERQQTT